MPNLRTTPVPVEAGLPLIGTLIPISKDPLGFLTDNTRRYPELVALKLMGSTLYQVTHWPCSSKRATTMATA